MRQREYPKGTNCTDECGYVSVRNERKYGTDAIK